MESEKQVLQFIISKQFFCITLDVVMRVIRLVALQAIPGTPDYCKGLLNLHGENMLILDLVTCLGLGEATDCTIDTPIILCEYENHKIGFLVDEVIGVKKIGAVTTEIAPFSNPVVRKLLAGTTHTSNGEAILLNADTLFDVGLAKKELPHDQPTA